MVNPIRVALAFTSMALFRRMAVGTAPKLRLTASLLKASLRNVASYRPHPMRQDAPLDDVERFQGVVLSHPSSKAARTGARTDERRIALPDPF